MLSDPNGADPQQQTANAQTGASTSASGGWYTDKNGGYHFAENIHDEKEFGASKFNVDGNKWQSDFVNTETPDFKYHAFYQENGDRTFTNNETGEVKHYPYANKASNNAHSSGNEGQSGQSALGNFVTTSKKVTPALAGGITQELAYTVHKSFDIPINNTVEKAKFKFSMREKTGYKGTTSELFFTKVKPASQSSKFKGLRLDYDYNIKNNNTVEWHWNNDKVKNADFGHGIGNGDHVTASKYASIVGKASKYGKIGGRFMLGVGILTDGLSLGQEIHKSYYSGKWSNAEKEGSRIAGAWAGAWATAEAFGTIGATFGVVGGPLGIAIGGMVGGLIGGIFGYIWGGAYGEKAYKYFRK